MATSTPRRRRRAHKRWRFATVASSPSARNDEIRKLKGAHTQVVDLGGHFVMPGFNDAHCHLQSGGFEQMNVNLVGAKSLAEMQQRIAERAKTAPAGDWIIGGGWDHTLWPEQTLPTRQDIDTVTNGHPANLRSRRRTHRRRQLGRVAGGGHHCADRASAGRRDRSRRRGPAHGNPSRDRRKD